MKTNLLLIALVLTQSVSSNKGNIPVSNSETTPTNAEKFKQAFNQGKLLSSPFGFMENKGQICGADGLHRPEVKFIMRLGSTELFLLEKGIAYEFTRVHFPKGYKEEMERLNVGSNPGKIKELQNKIRTETYRMNMTLIGANLDCKISTEGRSVDYSNFSNLNVFNVHSFTRVTYHEIYPGIDWVIYTKDGQVKYDFTVRPGAD